MAHPPFSRCARHLPPAAGAAAACCCSNQQGVLLGSSDRPRRTWAALAGAAGARPRAVGARGANARRARVPAVARPPAAAAAQPVFCMPAAMPLMVIIRQSSMALM